MGLFRALIVVAVSSFVLSVINDNKKLQSIPIIGEHMHKSVKEKKHLILIFVIALLELLL